ncbi:MAG: hypothetical protein MUE81_19730 [Thermoflexibacter sp.]|nr:hypothetical protein [Thermoflexibacter sp.]
MPANGKAFVQGGLDSTIAPQSTKPNKKHQSPLLAQRGCRLSPPCTNAMLAVRAYFIDCSISNT